MYLPTPTGGKNHVQEHFRRKELQNPRQTPTHPWNKNGYDDENGLPDLRMAMTRPANPTSSSAFWPFSVKSGVYFAMNSGTNIVVWNLCG